MQPLTEIQARSIIFDRWGNLNLKLHGDELTGPCPHCGGRDRFTVWLEDGGYMCRPGDGHCGVKGWLDDNQRRWKVDPLAAEKMKAREQLERQHRRDLVKAWQAGHSAGYWEGLYRALSQANREWYHARGIPDWEIEFYELGFTPNKVIQTPQGLLTVPAYTVPVRDPWEWQVVDIHYRLAHDLAGIAFGKYRFERDVPSASFYARPMTEGRSQIIVEGAFKALVLHDRIDNDEVLCVGLPSITPHPFELEQIAALKFENRYIIPDPGAIEQGRKIALQIKNLWPRSVVRLVSLPWKPDDAYRAGYLTNNSFREYLRQGELIR